MCEDAFAFWWARGHIEKGLDWLDRALTLTVPPEDRSSVLRAASYLRMAQNEYALAESLAREAVEIATTVDCYWVAAYARLVVGWCTDVAGIRITGCAPTRMPSPWPARTWCPCRFRKIPLCEKGDLAGALDAWRQGFQASCDVDDP